MQRRSILLTESPVVTIGEVAEPGPTEVLIKTRYCSLNYPDLLMTRRGYQLAPSVPFTLGSEALGTVVQCGSEVTSLRAGDVVLALVWHGAFSTHLILDAAPFTPRPNAMAEVKAKVTPSTLLRAPLSLVPGDLELEKVVAMGFAYSAAFHALKDRGRLMSGDRLLVLGASGGLGLAAVQVGLAMGAEVVAASREESGRALCRSHGATTIEYDQLLRDDRRKLELGRFEVVFDILGGRYTEPAVKALIPGGRLLIVGFVDGIPAIPTNLMLLRECSLVGAAWGSWASREPSLHTANLETLYSWLRSGKICPLVSEIYPLEDAAKALLAMKSGAIYGKVLLKA